MHTPHEIPAAPSPSAADPLAYKSLPFRDSRPEALAVIGALYALSPAPPDRCRVLELGCCTGGNLLPLAELYPQAEFLGIDSSTDFIADGRQAADELSLTNIRFESVDILNFAPDRGHFDFIIAHGVYSWVPPPVQDAVLRACRANLAPQGIAYVSFNTYPGWHQRGVIRDIMLFHTRRESDPDRRVRQAREIIQLLANLAPQIKSPYAEMIRQEQRALESIEDYTLLNDHILEDNHPVSFTEFTQRAAAQGLQFLADTDLSSTSAAALPPELRAKIAPLAADEIELGQYLDFIKNRLFRQTLLCHSEIVVDRNIAPSRLASMYAASGAKPEKPADAPGSSALDFIGRSTRIRVAEPALQAALAHLSRAWPAAVPIPELLAVARENSATAVDSNALLGDLLRAFVSGLIELTLTPSPFTTRVSPRPIASALARRQARLGPNVTNRRHETVRLDEFQRKLLALLDGTRDRDALAAELVPATGAFAGNRLDTALADLARGALLIA